MSKVAKKKRGVFERPAGSGIWWIRYADEHGRIRREKVGPRGAAIELRDTRKTEVRVRKKLPENFRARPITFGELAKDALEYSRSHKRSYGHDKSRMDKLLATFRERLAESI